MRGKQPERSSSSSLFSFSLRSPVRQYTAGGQPTPAQVVCTRPSECRTVQARQYGRDNGEFGWGSEEGGQVEEAFRTFGTLARRRHYNELVAGLWRAAFPNARVLDWEAITAPLPSDYCHDGEHWVTVLEVWRWYRIDPWAGHSMAGAEARARRRGGRRRAQLTCIFSPTAASRARPQAANVLVSLLCPALDINTKPPAIGEYERGGR